MLLAGEVRGELARIHPARPCCRRAELAGLLHGRAESTLRTLDHATARTAVQLASSVGIAVLAPRPASARSAGGGRHHLVVDLQDAAVAAWSWGDAPVCDRRSFLRGALLGCGSISFSASGPHVEFVLREVGAAVDLQELLGELGVRALLSSRRGRSVLYLKGQDDIAALFGLVGANRGLLELETQRVGKDVQARLNRLLNAEGANVDRTVQAADRQLMAIERLEADGTLARLPQALGEAAAARRRMPDADLDTLAAALGVSRSAVNHRLRRLVELGSNEKEADANSSRGRQLEDEPANAGGGSRARSRRG